MRHQLGLLLLLCFALNASRIRGEGKPTPPQHGQVVGSNGPISGAHIRFQGESAFVLSDKSGAFRLPKRNNQSRRLAAWKKGYAIATAPLGLHPLKLTLLPLPDKDNEGYQWTNPTPNPAQANNCGNCHRQIYREWQGSAHAQAAKNRRFLNLFAGTDWHGKPSPKWNVLAEHPLGSAVCATCHAPTYRDSNLDYDMRKVNGVSAHGIHCDYCHKIVDAPTDKLGLRFGRDGYDLLRPKNQEQLFFGPLPDAFRQGETFGYLPLYKESRYCASCHEGVVFGVRAYGTYSEWLKSPAKKQGIQCQDCHMKPTGVMTNIAPGKGGIKRDPLTLASHVFPGGTEGMLRQSLSVETMLTSNNTSTKVEVTVLAKHAGHRVPTGFIDRHLLLVVEATDRNGKSLPLKKGPSLPPAAGKKLSGTPGWLYAKLLHNREGDAPIPFWLPHGKIVDTRLQPSQPDRREFMFGSGVEQIRIRLLYRRFWQDVADNKQWPDNEIVVFDRTWKNNT